jgi:hypothetical protein
MLRRALRHERVFTDRDWRFLFGGSKQEVFTWRYGSKLGLAVIVCSVISAAEYLIILPFGASYYFISLGIAVLAIVVGARRLFIP